MIIGKIQLEIAINVVSSKDTWMHETHSKNENIEITIYDKAYEIKKDFFKSLLNRYQIGLETSRRDSVTLSAIVLVYCNTNVIKYIWNVVQHI